MPSYPNATSRLAPQGVQDSLRQIAAWALFWAFAAGMLFIAMSGSGTYGRLLVFCECAGMTITAIAMLMRPSRWFSSVSLAVAWLFAGVIAVPVGCAFGHMIAALILGEPFHLLSHGNDRMVPVVFTMLIGGFEVHCFAMRVQLTNEATTRSEAQRLAADSRLRMLSAQLEPHMLFNTLAILRSLVQEDSQRAELMIDQLITYLRSALAASRTEDTQLSNEFSQLRAYLEIMSLRMGPRLSYRLQLPRDLEQVSVPPMLLQPLVENAIKHGLEPQVGAGRIDVIARRTDAGVEISVTDTGCGLQPQSEASEPVHASGGSYGLLHVRERLRAVYGPLAALTLTSQTPAGVCARVSIPQ